MGNYFIKTDKDTKKIIAFFTNPDGTKEEINYGSSQVFKGYNGKAYCPYQINNITYSDSTGFQKGVLYMIPFRIPKAITVKDISFNVRQAGCIGVLCVGGSGKLGISIIKDNITNPGSPGEVIWTSPEVDATSGTKTFSTVNLTLDEGIYYIAYQTNSDTDVKLRGVSGSVVDSLLGVSTGASAEAFNVLTISRSYNLTIANNLSGVNPAVITGFIVPLFFFKI